MKIQKKDKADRKLGQILVDEGYLDADVLENVRARADRRRALRPAAAGRRRAALRVRRDLFARPTSACRFRWTPCWPMPRSGFRCGAAIREKIPSGDTRFAMASEPGEKPADIQLKPREWMLLCFLHDGRSVDELVEQTGYNDFETTADPLRHVRRGADRQSRSRRGDSGGLGDDGTRVEPEQGPHRRAASTSCATGFTNTPASSWTPADWTLCASRSWLVPRGSGSRTMLDYFRLLKRDEREFKELMNLVTINETSFFRFPGQFDALRTSVVPEILDGKSKMNHTFRAWSAGCSTGEEPYTIAMSLLESPLAEAGFTPEVLGTDVSTQALDRAREAVYRAKTLANLPPTVVEKWFEPVAGGLSTHCRRARRSRVLVSQSHQGALPAVAHRELGRRSSAETSRSTSSSSRPDVS